MSRDLFAARPALKRTMFKAMIGVASYLPLPLTRMLGYAVSTIAWSVDARGRRTVRRNLAHFIPPSCPRALDRGVWAHYHSFATQLSESLRLHRLPSWLLAPERLTLVDPWATFAKKPLRGPVILVTVHTNWELMLAAVHRLGLIEQVEAIALSHGDPSIDHIFERMRGAVGCRSLLLDRAPLAAVRALKAGRILGIIADRDYTGSGIDVPIAGQPMTLPLGPAALSVQTGAPIVPMYLARSGPNRFMLFVDKPLLCDPGLAKQRQMADLTGRLAGVFTRFIAAAPTQWIAFHDAWAPKPPTVLGKRKTLPVGQEGSLSP
ncbi:MAG: lysophospholipid acyltransferase family protein [Planctomycetes bacterium]|nr:lysophospholipid acyltransferase family protein [Planctomycetota bacterium]